MPGEAKPAVVLLSGGLDSATALAVARRDGFRCHALTVARDRSAEDMAGGIPITYVPARNTVFLSLALAWAEVLVSFDIYIGVNARDYSGYPDCRPEFVRAFEHLANLATKAGVEDRGEFHVHAPLIHLSKAEIIRLGA